jgi:tRNA/tmRNA/rRNA uracil-C5-methylase (TrmA/RlmC/RlmD family)
MVASIHPISSPTDHQLQEGCHPVCRGCAHRALSAQQSQTQKENWLTARLAPWRETIGPLQALAEHGRWQYRDKVCLATVWDECVGWQFGLMARDRLIPIPRCPVHSQRVQQTIALLTQALPPASNFPMAFYVQAGAQVTLILKTAKRPDITTWLDQSVQQGLAANGIEGLWLNLHPAAGRHLFAKRGWHLLWGQPRSKNNNGLIYGPSAFQQLIPTLYENALDEAEAFLVPSADTPIIDLYCGSGSTLARWVQRGAPTLGVELGGEAVECARQNAPQALVLQGKCVQRLPQLTTWLGEHKKFADQGRLYVNPPRTGLESGVLNWVAETFRPRRMAYLSCSAGTLRRDLERLTAAGYRVNRILPYDFFPQTHHVETLVLLKRFVQSNGKCANPIERLARC